MKQFLFRFLTIFFYVFDETFLFTFLTKLFFFAKLFCFCLAETFFLFRETSFGELHLVKLHLANFFGETSFGEPSFGVDWRCQSMTWLSQVPNWLRQWYWFFQTARQKNTQTNKHLLNYIIDNLYICLLCCLCMWSIMDRLIPVVVFYFS